MPSTAASHFSHLYASTYAKYYCLPLQPFICKYLCQVLPPAIYMPVLLPSTPASHFSHICKYLCQVLPSPVVVRRSPVLMLSAPASPPPAVPDIYKYFCQVLMTPEGQSVNYPSAWLCHQVKQTLPSVGWIKPPQKQPTQLTKHPNMQSNMPKA